MALSNAQKADVRRYLGFPDINREASPLESAMDGLSAEGETIVGELLTSLDTIETTLTGAWGRQKVKRAEEVTLAGFAEIQALRAEGNRLAVQLGGVFGITPLRLPFSTAASCGPMGRG